MMAPVPSGCAALLQLSSVTGVPGGAVALGKD